MADLTLIQRFGSNSVYNDTNKTLTIDLNDLTDTGDIIDGLGLDISSLTAANIDQYTGKILYVLILLNYQQQPTDNNDETLPVFITNGGKRSATRNQVSQFLYQLNVGVYINDNFGSIIDPDDLV